MKILDQIVHPNRRYANLAWIPLKKPISFDFYLNWLKQKKHAGMTYLETQKELRAQPNSWAPFAKSVLVIQYPYLTHPWPNSSLSHLEIAKYAQGFDYHQKMIEEMKVLIEDLKPYFPDSTFYPVTDSTPLMERDLAYQAGLGWFGKNTCLIQPKVGSFFLLGEILTSVDIENPETSHLVPDLCGKCRLCIETCPTQALSDGPTLDANLCLSYWNIESQEIAPDAIKKQMGSLFFGCDICQDVCPWNIKPLRQSRSLLKVDPLDGAQNLNKASTTFSDVTEELKFYLNSSNREITRHIQDTPLTRARPFGLRRNAIIVAVNSNLIPLKSDIQKCIERYPKLAPLKAWVDQNLT